VWHKEERDVVKVLESVKEESIVFNRDVFGNIFKKK